MINAVEQKKVTAVAQRAEGRATAQGRAVLVTGTSSGIGRSIATHLATHGFLVFGTVRKEADSESLRALGLPGLVPVMLDLAHREQIGSVVTEVESALAERGIAGLHALVNCAGGGAVAPVELMDLDDFSRDLDVRLVGSVGLVQGFLPSIRNAGGRIVWIATPGLFPTPYVTSIHACDFAVDCIARTLAIELQPWHIPTVLVRCGGIRTETGLRTVAQVDEALDAADPARAALYEARLHDWGKEMAGFDEKRTDPAEVAKTVHRALVASKPRRCYAVGHMSRLGGLLGDLPESVADSVLARRFQ
jgi:NAD(P)-dependent dehydrogenase (short-subunit alcohol dehydrogenase family)